MKAHKEATQPGPTQQKSTAELKAVPFISLNVQKNDSKFIFLLPSGCSYQDCYDALIDGSLKIQELAKAAIERAKEEENKDNGTKE